MILRVPAIEFVLSQFLCSKAVKERDAGKNIAVRRDIYVITEAALCKRKPGRISDVL